MKRNLKFIVKEKKYLEFQKEDILGNLNTHKLLEFRSELIEEKPHVKLPWKVQIWNEKITEDLKDIKEGQIINAIGRTFSCRLYGGGDYAFGLMVESIST
jgi:hypothetical protein